MMCEVPLRQRRIMSRYEPVPLAHRAHRSYTAQHSTQRNPLVDQSRDTILVGRIPVPIAADWRLKSFAQIVSSCERGICLVYYTGLLSVAESQHVRKLNNVDLSDLESDLLAGVEKVRNSWYSRPECGHGVRLCDICEDASPELCW